jgi:hypothetical protein
MKRINVEFQQIADEWEKRQGKSNLIALSLFGASLVLFVIASTLMFNIFWKMIAFFTLGR